MTRRLAVTLLVAFAMLFSLHSVQAGVVAPSGKLSLAKSTAASGTVTTGTITLKANATSTITYTLSSSDEEVATVPATVKLSKGKKSVNFKITAGYVSSSKTATITVVGGATDLTANLRVDPIRVVSLSFSPKSILSGGSSKVTVTLNGPAPSNGSTVKFTTKGPIAAATSVKVASGKTTASITIKGKEVLTSTKGTVTASLKGTASSTITVNPLKLTAVGLSSSAVTSGDQVTVTVTLSGPAPKGGIKVPVEASGYNTPGVETTVTVAEGQSVGSYVFRTPEVSNGSGEVVFAASYNGTTKSASLIINAPEED
jgi:hypothetical protein